MAYTKKKGSAQKAKAVTNAAEREHVAMMKAEMSMPSFSEASWARWHTGLNPSYGDHHGAFKNVKNWIGKNAFVRLILDLKTAFYDYGFSILPADGAESEEFDAWEKTVAKDLFSFRGAVWDSFLAYDNSVIFWRDGSMVPALTLELENCTFIDKLGYQILEYVHGLSAKEIEAIAQRIEDQDAAQLFKERYGKSSITIGEILDTVTGKIVKLEDEHFSVIKKTPVGTGFGWPSLQTIATSLGECDSLEFSEAVLAFANRQVIRMNKFGHETRYGPLAGSSAHFYKPSKGTAWASRTRGKNGLIDMLGNFDQSTEYAGLVDPKFFNVDRFDSVKERFAWWAGPVAWMLATKGNANDFLMPMLKTIAIRERERVLPYLTEAIFSAFKPPVPIEIGWSTRCFNDSRIGAELLKFAASQGMVSNQTVHEELGFNTNEEWQRKIEEIADEKKNPGVWQPAYDGAHGTTSTGISGGPNGRPPGTPDPKGTI